MKRTERVGAMIKTLTDTPSKLYSLQYFCEAFGAAKSSISEDINLADASVRATGTGFIETISGARGGVRFVPDFVRVSATAAGFWAAVFYIHRTLCLICI